MNEMIRFQDMTNDTPISILTSDQSVEMSVRDVIRWVAPQAPPQEALKFLLTCRTARLNPFLGEAYLVPMGGKWSTVISKAGYLKRAQQNPDYAGHEAGIIVQRQDPKTRQKVGDLIDIDGTIVPDGHLLVGGWARVWRSGVERPITARVGMQEFNKGSATWKTIPCTMIRKTALVNAIREAFAIGDSYDSSEIEPVSRARATVSRPATKTEHEAIEATYSQSEDPSLPPDLMVRIQELMAKANITQQELDMALAKRGCNTLGELSEVEANSLIRKLEEVANPLGETIADEIAASGNGTTAGDTAGDDPISGELPDATSPAGPAAPAEGFELPDVPRRGHPATQVSGDAEVESADVAAPAST
jgi:phage recombination protein Bet